jgi:hypothetical protein
MKIGFPCLAETVAYPVIHMLRQLSSMSKLNIFNFQSLISLIARTCIRMDQPLIEDATKS